MRIIIPYAHEPEDADGNKREGWKAPPNCITCKRHYGVERNDCDYDECDTHISYLYHCGHYRNIKKPT